MAQFKGVKFIKKPKSHMFMIKQDKDETLKDYITYFNSNVIQIKKYDDDLAYSAMMNGLKPSKFMWWVGKNDPTSFQELLNQTKKSLQLQIIRKGLQTRRKQV